MYPYSVALPEVTGFIGAARATVVPTIMTYKQYGIDYMIPYVNIIFMRICE